MKPTDRFSNKAEAYAKYRPSYPKEYLDYLMKTTGLTTFSTVADIGSGTGIFSQILLDQGLKVFAVEPNDEMRRKAELALNDDPQFLSINGTAEHTTLNDRCVDLITVAQAFHWFNKTKFKAECQRILKEDGLVALVWNSRDLTSPVHQEIANICTEFVLILRDLVEALMLTLGFFSNFIRMAITNLHSTRTI